MPKQKAWRALLNNFIDKLRIVSRDETSKLGEAGVKVRLWRSQRRILDELVAGMDENIRRFFVLKSRQLGSTTIFVIIALFWLAMHPKMKGALVVDQEKTRDDFREQIRNIITSIPAGYFGGAFGIKKGSDNRYMMAFTNGSQLNFLVAGTSGTKTAWGESSGYSLVLLTELANYGSADGLSNFEEAMSEVNPQRLYIYESTAKGFNHWRTRWLAARADPFTTRCIFVGWWAKESNAIERTDPRFALFGLTPPDSREAEKINKVRERYGYEITAEQLAWIRWRGSKDSQSEASLNQNQPWVEEDAFVMSGKSFFQTRLIAQDYERMNETRYRGFRFWLGNDFWSGKIEELRDELRKHEIEMRMWYPPVPEGRYTIGCDPAGGSDDKNDRHAISVWRGYADRLVQVAEYADNIAETRQAAWVLAYLGGIYRNCILNLELSGGYGKAVLVELEHIREMLRSDIYSGRRGPGNKDWTDFLDNARYYIYRRPDSPTAAGYIINWLTNGDNKRQIFNEFRDAHVNGRLLINSKPLLEEMQIIVQDGSEIGAPNNQKDDRCFAGCLANHAYLQHIQPTMMMLGDTYDAVTAREAGEHMGTNIVDRIVSQYLKQVGEGAPAEQTPAQAWMIERGLV